jgi:hypothetical protein
MDSFFQPPRIHELEVQPIGIQPAQDIFNHKDEVPQASRFRANLCALSQMYNMYFVASEDEIHVHQPELRLQKLPRASPRSELVLIPPTVGNKPGYMDEMQPHSINHSLRRW